MEFSEEYRFPYPFFPSRRVLNGKDNTNMVLCVRGLMFMILVICEPNREKGKSWVGKQVIQAGRQAIKN